MSKAAALALALCLPLATKAQDARCSTLAGNWHSTAVFYSTQASPDRSPLSWESDVWGRIENTCAFDLVSSNGCVISGTIAPPRPYSKAFSGTAVASSCANPVMNRSYNLSLSRRMDAIYISLNTGIARPGYAEMHFVRGTFIQLQQSVQGQSSAKQN